MTEVIKASTQTIRNLKDVPTSFRLAAFALLNTQKGSVSFVLPATACSNTGMTIPVLMPPSLSTIIIS